MSTTNCLFFYGGPLSQWYPSRFTADGITYCTAEQYMMAMKAEFFNDPVTKLAILNTENPREQKALGRQVVGFNPEAWNLVARDIVTHGNVKKFGQNADLLSYLLSTGDRELVEASPTDCVWGIGLGMGQRELTDRALWRGTNWLGLALMDARTTLRRLTCSS